MASALRITLRQAGHNFEGSEEGPIGWLTHYDWMLQPHDEAEERDPYLVDNKFQGDEAQKNVTVGNEDAKQWGSQCRCKPITVFGPVYLCG